MNVNPLNRNKGEEFEYYVERSFKYLHSYLSRFYSMSQLDLQDNFDKIEERLTKMATLAEQLGVEETTLAEVVPQLATEITTLQSSLTTKETELQQDATTLGADSAELAANQAELAAIQKVQESLAPVVAKAKELVPASPVTPPVETPVTPPAEEQPATPPSEETPVAETETPPAETPVETPPVETPAEGTPPANPEG